MVTTLLVVALIVFAAGIIAGVMLVVTAGIQREDRNPFLTREAPDQVTRAARRLTGLWVVGAAHADADERETTLV